MGLQGGSAINKIGWWWSWHGVDKAEYAEVYNLDKEEPEGVGALWDAQTHCGINDKPLTTPVLNRFAYLIHFFRYLMENKPIIESLYWTMPGIHDNIWERRPSLVDWEVIQMVVTIIKRIVGSILLNQWSGKEWLLSEAIVDMVRIYTYFSGDDADDDVSKHLYTMVEGRGNPPYVENLRSNLIDVHSKMGYWVKDNLNNVLAPLLQILAPKKNTTTGSIFFLTHGISWSLNISRLFIRVKMWTPKYLYRIWCPSSINTSWMQNLLSIKTPHI